VAKNLTSVETIGKDDDHCGWVECLAEVFEE
jgi:hypothetical protein